MEDKTVENILDECAVEIRKCEKKILADCFEIGKQLLKARDALRQWGGSQWNTDHEGKWLKWLDDLKMSNVKATRYIQVYEKYGIEKSQLIDVDNLKIDVSFYVLATLAAPHADPVAVVEVEKEIKQGKKLTVVEVLKRVPSTRNPSLKIKLNHTKN